MPTRTARTGWTGTLEQGVGKVELTSSKLATYEVSFPKRAAEDAGGATSPEELIAAAHSSCYAMQLSALVAQAGGTPQALDVQADVTLGPDPAGGFKLTGIKLTVRGEVDGLTAEQFLEAAQACGLPANDDFNGPQQDGSGFYQVTQKDGRRWSAADAYLRPAMARPNLEVLTDALVTP